MILPNKLIRFQDSIIAKTVCILDEVSLGYQSINGLYNKVNKNFEDVNQYILALDVLFALEKIKFDEKAQVLIYVNKDNL